MISNESDHDIFIPAKCEIAEVNAHRGIGSQVHSLINTSSPNPCQKSSLKFNFGESPVRPEGKDRIANLLNGMPDVFVQHDLDFGRTDRVTHRITQETPFKYHTRPIHPQDIEAVRKHI